MRGRKKTYVVALQSAEREDLRRLAAAHKTPQAQVRRARILLACDTRPDAGDKQIASGVGCSPETVRKWRKRWAETRSIKDAPRTGCPRAFSPEVRAYLTALACSPPEEAGVPISRWSHSELAAVLVRSGAVASIATSTVWRWLDAERIKPWQYHLWQRPIDPLFVERALVVLDLYQRAEALMERGVWVVCADEKTSIQARERIHPVDPAIPGHPPRVASRYNRRGALQLFAGLSVADGRVYGCCRERRRFADFQAFFLEVLAKESLRRKAEEVRLILDNGSTHAPKQLEGWLAEQQRENDWPFSVAVSWLPRYASWLDQIEIWFSVLQRKVLTPNHFQNLEELSERIMAFIEHYDRSAKPIEWSYTVAQMEEKFGTN